MTRRKAQTEAANGDASHVSISDAFPDEMETEPPAPLEAHAGVVPTPSRRSFEPPRRRISPEVGKAETKLYSLERRRQESLEHHEYVWAEKREALIKSFPAEVLNALVAMKVLGEQELEAIDD